MNVSEFLDGLQRGGYWREVCIDCHAAFDATEGEDTCHECRRYSETEEYEDE